VNPIPCLAPEDLENVRASASDDSRRVHARECPRCGALLAAYESYHEAREEAPRAEIDEAESRLNAFLAREIGADAPAAAPALVTAAAPGAAPAPAAAPTPAPLAPPRPAPRRLVFPAQAPRFTWIRPALGFAAILAVAGALWWPRTTLGPSRVTLRGSGATAPRIALETPVFASGRLTLDWAAYPGADRYEVRFYSSDLTELGRLTATDSKLAADAKSLPFAPDSARAVLVRVVALMGGAELASSAPKTILVK